MPEMIPEQPQKVYIGVGKFFHDQRPAAHAERMMKQYDEKLIPKLHGKAVEIADKLRPAFEVYAKAAGIYQTAAEIQLAAAAVLGAAFLGKNIIDKFKKPPGPTQIGDGVRALLTEPIEVYKDHGEPPAESPPYTPANERDVKWIFEGDELNHAINKGVKCERINKDATISDFIRVAVVQGKDVHQMLVIARHKYTAVQGSQARDKRELDMQLVDLDKRSVTQIRFGQGTRPVETLATDGIDQTFDFDEYLLELKDGHVGYIPDLVPEDVDRPVSVRSMDAIKALLKGDIDHNFEIEDSIAEVLDKEMN